MTLGIGRRLARGRSRLYKLIVVWKVSAPLMAILPMLLVCAPAWPQLSVSMGLPSVRIGINVPAYPNLVPIPGYPVYYDPRLDSNLFFYDGLYWVYAQDNWYVSSWYDGPWELVEPEWCRISFCGFRWAITAFCHRTFSGGIVQQPLVGASTGAMTGMIAGAGGTIG